MRSIRNAAVVAFVVVAQAAPAHADIFTWTDASGRTNISNVEPPKDVGARRIATKELPKKPGEEAARAAARSAAEVHALKDRVAQLETEVEEARQRANAASYRVPVPASPPVVVVAPPPPAYAPPPAAYSEPPDFLACDPLTFGCPAFGYPVNVVVLKNGRGFRRFDRRHFAHRVHAVPAHPALPAHRR